MGCCMIIICHQRAHFYNVWHTGLLCECVQYTVSVFRIYLPVQCDTCEVRTLSDSQANVQWVSLLVLNLFHVRTLSSPPPLLSSPPPLLSSPPPLLLLPLPSPFPSSSSFTYAGYENCFQKEDEEAESVHRCTTSSETHGPSNFR